MNSKEQILSMVKEGNITVEEGLDLLNALDSNDQKSQEKPIVKVKKPFFKRMLSVEIQSKENENVKINVPLALAKIGLKTSGKLNLNGQKIDLSGIDLDDILSHIDEDTQGEILTLDTDDGDHIRIFID